MTLRRGDVVTVADRSGQYTGKPRPAVIVHSNAFAARDSLTICPMTSQRSDAPILRLPIERSAELPLQLPSWIQVDKITAVRRDRVSEQPIGRLSSSDLVRLNASLAVYLAIG